MEQRKEDREVRPGTASRSRSVVDDRAAHRGFAPALREGDALQVRIAAAPDLR
jgi:hypothetical protein